MHYVEASTGVDVDGDTPPLRVQRRGGSRRVGARRGGEGRGRRRGGEAAADGGAGAERCLRGRPRRGGWVT